MSEFYPPFLPVFGNGPPGALVPHSSPYFDMATMPFTPYIYDAGWHIYGGGGAGGTNATSLQGIGIDPTAPTNNQVLQYVNGTGLWTPTTPANGPVPAVVQIGYVTGVVGPVTLAAPPTQNNLLVALVTTQGVNPPAGGGWTIIPGSNAAGAPDDVCSYYKIAGAGESAIQTPTTDVNAGTVTIFELENATPSALYGHGLLNAAGPAIAVTQNVSLAQLVIGVATNHSAAIPPTGVTGGTFLDVAKTGGARTQRAFKATAPVIGANTFTANYGANTTGCIMSIEIG